MLKYPFPVSLFCVSITKYSINKGHSTMWVIALHMLGLWKSEKKFVAITVRTAIPESRRASASPISASRMTFAVWAFPRESRYSRLSYTSLMVKLRMSSPKSYHEHKLTVHSTILACSWLLIRKNKSRKGNAKHSLHVGYIQHQDFVQVRNKFNPCCRNWKWPTRHDFKPVKSCQITRWYDFSGWFIGRGR